MRGGKEQDSLAVTWVKFSQSFPLGPLNACLAARAVMSKGGRMRVGLLRMRNE